MIEPATLFDTNIFNETRLSADVRPASLLAKYCCTTPGGTCSSKTLESRSISAAEDALVSDTLASADLCIVSLGVVPAAFAVAAARRVARGEIVALRSGDESVDPVPVRGLDGGVVAVVVVLDTTGGDADLL